MKDPTESTDVLVVGSGGHALVVIDALEGRSVLRCVGLLDSFEVKGAIRHGYRVAGRPEEAAEVARETSCTRFITAIGDNWGRSVVTRMVLDQVDGARMMNVIHPSAVVSKSARLGSGVVICAGAVVGPAVEVGDGVLVNTGATVDHECRLEAFCSVGPGARLAGRAVIREGSAVCMGALVRDTEVGAWTVVGAGSLVLNAIPSGVLAFGIPAKVVRERKPHETYL